MTPADLITTNRELVALSKQVRKLNQVIGNPGDSADNLTDIILQDRSLSTHLLHVANSPFYHLSSWVDSVSQAISAIGSTQLRDIIFATKIADYFIAIPIELVSSQHFWRHNIICATACKVIAGKINYPRPEQLFLTGLLHDIGKLIMYIAQPKLSSLVNNTDCNDKNIRQVEYSIFGFNHCDVGAELLRHWKLTDSVIEPILYHHAPAESENFLKEASIVNLGDAVANTIKPAISADDDIPVDPGVWEYLGIDDTALESIIEETRNNIDAAIELFNLPGVT